MTEKMRAYLDGIFAVVPQTDEVKEAKEELFTGMVERYNDLLLEGMDEQQAYDNVIEGIGDIRELFQELNDGPAPTAADSAEEYYNTYGSYSEEGPKDAPRHKGTFGIDLHEIVQSVTDFTSGLVSGLFSTGDATAAQQLVNTQTISLENVTAVDVSYIAESITLLKSENDQLVLKEYMNRDEQDLYAQITLRGSNVNIRNGRRNGVFGLRSHIEVYLPESFEGSLALGSVSGSIRTTDDWTLASLQARTISGEVEFASVEAGLVRLCSTSGTVKLHRGVGSMDLHSISGSIRVAAANGSGSFKTTSGAVRIDFTELTGPVEASTVSGGVRLMLPEGASFELEGRSVSGGIYTGFDNQLTFERRNKAHGLVGEAPYHHIKVSSTSGSIHVND